MEEIFLVSANWGIWYRLVILTQRETFGRKVVVYDETEEYTSHCYSDYTVD